MRKAIDGASPGYKLLFSVVAVVAIVGLLAAASIAFGWSLYDGPPIDITTDPVGELPF
jgi:hypothetical protein